MSFWRSLVRSKAVVFPCCCLFLVTSLVFLYRTNAVQKTLRGELRVFASYNGKCSIDEINDLINTPLPISVRENVKTDSLESTGCFKINKERPGIWRLLDEANFKHTKCRPTKKRFLPASENDTHIALASFPGSGNTWVRHLLEELTGVFTGSVYGSRVVDSVFQGEHTIHNVIAIKTHGAIEDLYDKAILIVRDMFDAVLANTNRRMVNKTAIVSKSRFDKDGFQRDLRSNLLRHGVVNKINTFKGDIFVLFYDRLQNDLANSLTKLAAFCRADVTLTRLYCTLQNSVGSFKRGEKPEWMSRENLIDDDMERDISKWKDEIRLAIKRRNCATN